MPSAPLLLVVQGPDLRVTAVSGDGRPEPGTVVGRPLAVAFPALATEAVLDGLRRVLDTGRPVDLGGEDVHVRATPVPEADSTLRTIVLDVVPVAADATPPPPPSSADLTDDADDIADTDGTADDDAAWEETVAQILGVEPPRLSADHRIAVAEQRYAEARDVIAAVQDELLPPGVPVLPTMRLAATYLPAGIETSAGGDWFEAIRLPNGTIGLAVGDVVGHGMTASTAMGQLRVLLRERLMDTGNAISTLGFLDRAAQRVRGALSATVCLVIIDPETGRLEYSTAGHPPPLVISPSTGARYLAATGGAPLGAGRGYQPGVDRLGPGESLLLYTDGLLERPGCTVGEGIAELAETAAGISAEQARLTGACDPGPLAERTVRRLIGETGFRDDITVLAAQLRAAPRGLDLLVHAGRENLAPLRTGLEEWLAEVGVHGHQAQLLQHAVGELVANAVEHAYRDSRRPGVVAVRAQLTVAGDIMVRVADQGRWREPGIEPDPERGLGLSLVTDLVDEFRLEHDRQGTTATLRHHPWIPAQTPAAADLAVRLPRRPAAPDPFLVLGQPSAPRNRVRVDGPIDAQTAPTLYLELRASTSSGTRDITVDLTGTTHLSSAGVAVLQRMGNQAERNNTELCLYAPPGSPAHLVLSLARLRHTTTDPDVEEDAEPGTRA